MCRSAFTTITPSSFRQHARHRSVSLRYRTCPAWRADFVSRHIRSMPAAPGDGLYPFLRRYGLQLSEPPLLLEHPSDRYNALLNQEADAAVAFTTDGLLAGRQLRILEDLLEFFPRYDAAIIVAERALKRHPGLGEGLETLAMRVDTESMRNMNAEVQLEGRKPEHVAAEFLQQRGMID